MRAEQGGEPLIGVLGASGAVGGLVAAEVIRLGLGRLRLGIRRPEAGVALEARYPTAAETAVADVGDPGRLAAFCAGCRLVINCAAGLGQARAGVAAAALAAGADYLDPGGDEALRARLAARPLPGGRAALVAAGVQPGLTELLPRWLAAEGLEPPLTLTAYIATMDKMTRASAEEFLLSLGADHGEPAALWRAGARHSRGLDPPTEVSLPFFRGPVVAYPHLSADAERMARRLHLAEARCYDVFEPGGNILTALSRLRHQFDQGGDLASLADELMRAADLEMFGRTPAQQLVMQLDGRLAGEPAARLAVLRAASTYQLTAVVTVLAAGHLLAGLVPPGAHAASDVLSPSVIDALPGRPGVAGLHLLDGPLANYARAEQGAV